jgi:glycine cleavage system H protein
MNSDHIPKYAIDSSHVRREDSVLKVADSEIREGLYYTKEHEWMKLENEKCRVGITDYAQKSLHEVVYVDLPNVGKALTQNVTFGTVESVKAVSELYSPVSGEVVERNEKLVESPELVNQDPYGAGWIVIVKPSRLPDDLKTLMNAEGYVGFLEEVTKKK